MLDDEGFGGVLYIYRERERESPHQCQNYG